MKLQGLRFGVSGDIFSIRENQEEKKTENTMRFRVEKIRGLG